jgi:hypothetical protein
MKKVFLLQHLHIDEDECEDAKIIGIYFSYEEGKQAIDRLSKQPGFSEFSELIDPTVDDYRSGFYLDEYEVGKDQWQEGFVTVHT